MCGSRLQSCISSVDCFPSTFSKEWQAASIRKPFLLADFLYERSSLMLSYRLSRMNLISGLGGAGPARSGYSSSHQDLLPPPPLTCFRESSNRLTMTSQRVSRHSCFAVALICGEKSVSPAARSTASTEGNKQNILAPLASWMDYATLSLPGTLKAVNGVLSGITALGRTNAPRATSLLEMGPLRGSVELNPELPARAAMTTLAK